MHKFLMGTTALAVAGFLVTPASAAEWDISVGGYFIGGIAYTDAGEGDSNEFDFASDSEIQFRPSITLDNGLTFGVDIDLDPEQNSDVNNNPDLIDEAFAYVQGGFGRFELGQTYGVGAKLSVQIPGVVGHSVNNNDEYNMDPFDPYDVYTGLQWTSLRNRINTDLDFTNDNTKLNYFTPSMNGFQAGLSYTPNPGKNDTGYGDWVYDDFARDYWELAASWEWQVNNVLWRIFGGGGIGDSGESRDEPYEWSAGSMLRFGGFELYGVYTEHDTRYEYHMGDLFYDTKVQVTVAGSYQTGPWTFDLQGGRSESGNHENDGFNNDRVDAQYDSYLAGITYQAGPGIEFGGGIQHFAFDRDTHGNFTNNNFDTDGTSLFFGTKIGF